MNFYQYHHIHPQPLSWHPMLFFCYQPKLINSLICMFSWEILIFPLCNLSWFAGVMLSYTKCTEDKVWFFTDFTNNPYFTIPHIILKQNEKKTENCMHCVTCSTQTNHSSSSMRIRYHSYWNFIREMIEQLSECIDILTIDYVSFDFAQEPQINHV